MVSRKRINHFSTRTCFYIHSTYCLAILCSFRNLCGDLDSEDCSH
ncbi:hypothetical protein E2C01_006672 [Portunus trituberculatus]|uniref:Uncharacterized protein n=1 Tax=Portunus trituberculatus TaxID=210409 RepID=A0A5B7D2F9_PORTR|nr:hypothetical protein [Portunus trituberculatus]